MIKNIKDINKTDTITEREVTVQAGPQGDAKTNQIVTVNRGNQYTYPLAIV